MRSLISLVLSFNLALGAPMSRAEDRPSGQPIEATASYGVLSEPATTAPLSPSRYATKVLPTELAALMAAVRGEARQRAGVGAATNEGVAEDPSEAADELSGDPFTAQADIESTLEAEQIERLAEMERAFGETAVDPEEVDSQPTPPRQELYQTSVDNFIKSEPKYLAGLFARLLVFGRGRELKRWTTNMVQRLSMDGDSQNYTIRYSGSLFPNAMIQPAKALLIISLGLIGFAKNVDEAASVLAHEMTHENKALLKALEDAPDINAVLSQVSGYSSLPQNQREELRADLGAIKRMIKGGFNPWAAYDLEKRFADVMDANWDLKLTNLVYRFIFRRSIHYMADHPTSEIRMAAIKAYILQQSQATDLADQTSRYQNFAGLLKTLHLQMQALTLPIVSPTGQRLMQYSLVGELGYLFFKETWVAQKLGLALAPVGEIASPLAGTIGHLFSFAFTFLNEIIQKIPSLVNHAVTLSTLALLFGLPLWLHHDFKKYDEKAPDFMAAKETLSEFVELNRLLRTKGSARQAVYPKMLALLNKSATLLQGIHAHPSYLSAMSWITGLSSTTRHTLRLYRKTLSSLARDLSGFPPDEREQAISGFLNEMDRTPGFVLESKRIAALVAKIATSSTRFRFHASTDIGDFMKSQLEQEAPGNKTLSLILTANGLTANSPAGLRVRVAHVLLARGAVDWAFQLVSQNLSSLTDQITGGQESDPVYTRQLWDILVQQVRHGSLRRTGYFASVQTDLRLSLIKLKARLNGRADLALSLTRTIPARPLLFGRLNVRGALEQHDARLLEEKLVTKFNSVSELLAYLDREVSQKGGLIENLRTIVIQALARRPDWIHDLNDAYKILDRLELWPQFSTQITGSSPLEQVFVHSIARLRDRFPTVWKFEPAYGELAHAAIMQGLTKHGTRPTRTVDKFTLWIHLTDRGVTTVTDGLFQEVYKEAAGQLKEDLERLALEEGRVWETEIKAQIAQERIFNSSYYKDILNAKSAAARLSFVRKTVAEISAMVPEGGRVYWDLLEELSVRIDSSAEESKEIHAAKTRNMGGNKQEDFSLRLLSDLTNEALNWSKEDQWGLIQYLRGRGPVTEKVQRSFGVIGPERVRRMYDLLPALAKAELIDVFVDAPRGLLGKFNVDRGWGKTILAEIFAHQPEDEVKIAREVLEGFLYALRRTGNGALRTYVISYLLAQRGENNDTATILKNVLEIFGPTGVKIGQMLVASQLLPERMTVVLRTLQERAKIPLREDIYKDIRDVLGKDDIPFKVGRLKGAASIKYALEIFDRESMKRAIVKIFRLEAIAHTRLEFNLLDQMAGFLVGRHGKKYGIFKSIVRASRAAVERELVPTEEVKKSLAAQRYIYVNLDEDGLRVKAPSESLLADRAIISEYAEGVSFFDLRDDIKIRVARKILTMEGDNLFADKPLILFDPDRHAGNYRIHVQMHEGHQYLVLEAVKDLPQPKIDIGPIDMGQLLSFRPADRERVIETFAISQILKLTGPTAQLIRRIADLHGLTESQTRTLRRQLYLYFPDQEGKEVTAYFALLAAIEGSGKEIDIIHWDFVRGIIQLQQYETYIPTLETGGRTWKTPSERFAEAVRAKVNELAPGVELNNSEALFFAWRTVEGGFFSKVGALARLIISPDQRGKFKDKVERSATIRSRPNPTSCEKDLLDKVD